MPLSLWQETYTNNIQGIFLTIKHFLLSAAAHQTATGQEIPNLAIVVTGSEGHTEYASGKAGLQYGLVRGVKNEIVRLNSKARINAVAPGWVDTPLIDGRLDDPTELWAEAQATVPLRKLAPPADVARTMAFLSSHRAAGHITGKCISVNGGMEGRVDWKEGEEKDSTKGSVGTGILAKVQSVIPTSLPSIFSSSRPKIKILLSIDFDAVSGFLGTGASPTNNMADYSSGIFAGRKSPRSLRLQKQHTHIDNRSWCSTASQAIRKTWYF